MSNSTYVSCGCSQSSGPGLGEAVAGIPAARLRKWVQGLKQQEGGRLPTVSKLNGNMGWYKRTKSPGNEKYDLYNHFGWSANRVLNYLKETVPEEFGLAPKQTAGTTKTKISPPATKVADSASTQPAQAPAAPSIGGLGKSKLIIGGGVLAAGAAIFVMTRN